jgi:peptidyl-prolyl cis-trans isomerase B (cyclophilin B)
MFARRRLSALVCLTALLLVSGCTTTQPLAASPTNPPGTAACSWHLVAQSGMPSVQPGMDSSLTPDLLVPNRGLQTVTFTTNRGVITVDVDLQTAPCTAASLAFLAKRHFYDGTGCFRLVNDIAALQCGDPTGSGSGGPGYQFADENLPAGKLPAYHAGDVAMANAGPDTNGSQFFFIYGNTSLQGNYTLWGHVTSGLDVVKGIGAGGDDGAFAQQAGGGHPNIPLTFTTVTVGAVH